MGRPRTKVTNDDTKHTLAKNLTALLKHRLLSQNALSKLCTISQKQINNLVRAQTDCSLGALTELASALDVAPWLLLHPDAPKMIGRTNKVARIVDDIARAAEPDVD